MFRFSFAFIMVIFSFVTSAFADVHVNVNYNEAYAVFDGQTGEMVQTIAFSPYVINAVDGTIITRAYICDRNDCYLTQFDENRRYIFEKIDPKNIIR